MSLMRTYFHPGQLAVQGLGQRYARSKIKIFTYPDKQLVQQFDDLSDNNTFIPCVSSLPLYLIFPYLMHVQ